MPSSRSGYESSSTPRVGSRHWVIVSAIVVTVLVAGVVVLGLLDVAPDPIAVEKVSPGDRLSR